MDLQALVRKKSSSDTGHSTGCDHSTKALKDRALYRDSVYTLVKKMEAGDRRSERADK